MTLVRTPFGLANIRYFLGVDWVVFTEGGISSYTLRDVEAGRDNGPTLDKKFWSSVFKQVAPDTTIAIKSVGSKTTLLLIANQLSGLNLQGVAVAMDADFDVLFKRDLRDVAPVVVTYGYSWEADVWLSARVVTGTIRSLSLFSDEELARVEPLIDEGCRTLVRDTRWAVRGDVLLSAQGSSGIDRRKSMRYFEAQKGSVRIRREELRKTISEGRSNISQPAIALEDRGFESHRHLVGHFVADYWYCFVLAVIEHLGPKVAISKELVSRVAVSVFASLIEEPLLSHYEGELSRAGILA